MSSGTRKVVFAATITFLLLAALSLAGEPGETRQASAMPAPTPDQSSYAGYKGTMVGQTAADVRSKLGDPKDKSDAMDLYVFSDHESAQFYYDAKQTVNAIMITYGGDLKKAPTPKEIFGEDAPAKPDGGIFKMVRYPKSGFWISYNRTAGDDAIVSVAIQRI